MFKLQGSSEFYADISDTKEYISSVLHNPSAAKKMVRHVRETLSRIKSNPYLYLLYHNDRIAAIGYRFAAVGKYILFYRVDEDKKIILISRFIYGRRDMERTIQ